MIFKQRILNEKFGNIPSWLSNRLNAVKPMSKTGNINSKLSSTEYGEENIPKYQSKWNKKNPEIHSLYDQLISAGYDLANMKAEEQPIPSRPSEIKRIEEQGMLPVWLLKNKDNNQTQVYIPGINDMEETIITKPNENHRLLTYIPFKELRSEAIKFAVLSLPMKDPVKQQLRKELAKIVDKIEDAKESTEEVIEDIPEISNAKNERAIDKALNETLSLFKNAEFLVKNLIFELDEYDEEDLDLANITFTQIHDNFIVPLFYWAEEINKIKKHKEELFDKQNIIVHRIPNSDKLRDISDVNVELTMDGDWVDTDTGEVYFTENYPLEAINVNLESIINDLKNSGFSELDWE